MKLVLLVLGLCVLAPSIGKAAGCEASYRDKVVTQEGDDFSGFRVPGEKKAVYAFRVHEDKSLSLCIFNNISPKFTVVCTKGFDSVNLVYNNTEIRCQN